MDLQLAELGDEGHLLPRGEVLVPQARSAVAAGTLLVVLYTISDFGVVSLLRYGTLTQQTTVAQKLDVIDKWGKILTVITVLFGLLIAAAYVLAQFSGRSSLGA